VTVIVSCPSCGTLYRHEVEGTPRRARCSCCDGTVHVGVRRSYAVRPAFPDDPGSRAFAATAPGLVAAAARAAGVPPPPLNGPATPPSEGVRRVGMDDPRLAPALQSTSFDRPGDSAMLWTMLAPDSGAPVAAGAEPPPATENAPRNTGRIRRGIVGMGVGSICGLGLSTLFGGNVAAWWGGGAVAGLGLAWGVARWASRRS
jgi:hypothetical protein